jgi:hypothetical protein
MMIAGIEFLGQDFTSFDTIGTPRRREMAGTPVTR